MTVSRSTDVLDTGAGKPAAGVRVEFAQDREVLAKGEQTRTAGSPGSSRGSSPAARAVFWPPSPFFTKVELEVGLADGHHHVPLLVSPYGCTSYRGS